MIPRANYMAIATVAPSVVTSSELDRTRMASAAWAGHVFLSVLGYCRSAMNFGYAWQRWSALVPKQVLSDPAEFDTHIGRERFDAVVLCHTLTLT